MTRKEALEYINNMWMSGETHDALEVLIPEFGESEDERIRKIIYNCVYECCDTGYLLKDDRNSVVAWLEKQKECLDDNNKTSTDEDERIRKEINILYSDIDACITELLKARTDKDSESEGKALFKMEGLMVATLQDLSCIEDYLEKQKKQKPEWSKDDKRKLNRIYEILGQAADEKPFGSSKRIIGDKEAVELQDFIKLLSRSWKPSEEQMEALEAATVRYQSTGLESLYEDLKKL